LCSLCSRWSIKGTSKRQKMKNKTHIKALELSRTVYFDAGCSQANKDCLLVIYLWHFCSASSARRYVSKLTTENTESTEEKWKRMN
ncbi:hypothetical protein ACFL27_28265, partial [candidate division CSSED10-310 bacterium]